AICLVASGRLSRRMKLVLAVAAGQVCHCNLSAVTVWPSGMSALATRTSTVLSCGCGDYAAGFGAELLARQAAMAQAPRAMARTISRAGFIRFTFHNTPRQLCGSYEG